jgi:selenophosphate synthetase-related protein
LKSEREAGALVSLAASAVVGADPIGTVNAVSANSDATADRRKRTGAPGDGVSRA